MAAAEALGLLPMSGIWDSVRLEIKPSHHLLGRFCAARILRRRCLALDIDASAPGNVRVSVLDTPIAASGAAGTMQLDFPDYILWSPETPMVYTLRCELLDKDGRPIDVLEQPFGMRECTVKDGRMCLNNHSLYVKGVLAVPPSPASPDFATRAKKQLESAREAGFNLVRFIQPPPESLLHLCDAFGLMVWEDMPLPGSRGVEEEQAELSALVSRGRNHPSVIAWTVYSSAGGHEALLRSLRALDPTRLVFSYAEGNAFFLRPFRDAPEPFDSPRIVLPAPLDLDGDSYCRHAGEPEMLCVPSPIGVQGVMNIPQALAHMGSHAGTPEARCLQSAEDALERLFTEHDLGRVFNGPEAFYEATQLVQAAAVRIELDACRANGKASGYCYARLAAGGASLEAGLLAGDGAGNAAFDVVREAQQPLRPLIHMAQTNLVPRQETGVSILMVNEERLDERVDLSLQVVGPTNQVLWKKRRSIKLVRTGKEIWSGDIAASGSTGPHRFIVRLLLGAKVVSESSVEFQVYAPADPSEALIDVVDTADEWRTRCAPFARLTDRMPAVHIVPPLANTIRAYPAEKMAQVIAEVREGAVAIVFSPPCDWNDLATWIDPSVQAASLPAHTAFHYAKLHPVFEGLPSRGLMRQPYRDVVPRWTFPDKGEEDICGAIWTSPSGEEPLAAGANILVRRLGSGRMVFTHLRILEQLGEDPLADRLFVNLLRHFARRSVPSEEPVAPDAPTQDWLKQERVDAIRRWMVLGMFPNWNGEGFDTPYPPEHTVELQMAYSGWCKPIRWRRWYSCVRERHLVELQEALEPFISPSAIGVPGAAYAYAEFNGHDRCPIHIHIGAYAPTKIWLNGRLLLAFDEQRPANQRIEPIILDATIKQGKNTLLVKVAKSAGACRFSLEMESATRIPLSMNWWK